MNWFGLPDKTIDVRQGSDGEDYANFVHGA
jgi:hypothetical protein